MRFPSLLLACLALAACGGSATTDAGTDSGPADAGHDGGPPLDGGSDAGPDLSFDAGADGGADAGADAAADADVDADVDAAADADVDAGMDAAAFGLPDAGAIFDAAADDGGVFSSVTTTHPAGTPIAPATECVVTRADTTSRSALHVLQCSVITTWETTPPCHGDHYPVWADFKTYPDPVPWGFLVHALEHGAMVIAYQCGASCPALRDALQAFIDGYPADPLCSTTTARSRMILVPEPTLPVPIAAATWGHLYEATCLDLASLTTFADDTYAMAPEDFCSPGFDLSAQPGGWCPPPVMDAGVDASVDAASADMSVDAPTSG